MTEIKWTAGNGKEIKVANVTEEMNFADHTVMNKVDKIEVTIDNSMTIFQGLIDFENGKAIQVMGTKIRIPADKQAEVIEMIESQEKRYTERIEAIKKADAKYEAGYKITKEAMEE